MYSQIPKNLTKENEVKALRTANAKFFRDIAGKGIANFHTGHIHYFNKDKVGDGEERWREIDWTLVWNDKKRGWEFKYHSFQPFLPEYADEWIEFRDLWDGKDQMIRYRPVADRVKGRLVLANELAENGLDKLTFANCVVYDNAFGKGIDLILYFTRSQLKKVVRIHNASKDVNGMSFDFEIDLPSDKNIYRQKIKSERQELYRYENTKKVLNFREYEGYKLEMKDKEFDSNKSLMVGNDNQDGREWFTHIKPFLVWDSQGLIENIKVDFYVVSGKTYIKKKISSEFIDKSVGDIFTDTTTSYYAGEGDGQVEKNSNSWEKARTGTGSTAIYNTISEYGGFRYNSGNYTFYHLYYPIDTSGLGSSATISSATFNVHCRKGVEDGGGNYGLIQTSQSSTSSLSTSDFDSVGTTRGANDIDGNLSTVAYSTWTLNATGIGWISKTGYTKLGIRNSNDIDNSSTTITTRAEIWFSEQTGTSNDPYLSVTYVDSSSSSSSSSSFSSSSSSSSSSFSSSSSSSSFSSSSSSSSFSSSSSSSSFSSSSSSSSFSSSSSSFSSCSSSSSFSSSSSSSSFSSSSSSESQSSSSSASSFSSSSSSSSSFSSSSSSFSSSSSSESFSSSSSSSSSSNSSSSSSSSSSFSSSSSSSSFSSSSSSFSSSSSSSSSFSSSSSSSSFSSSSSSCSSSSSFSSSSSSSSFSSSSSSSSSFSSSSSSFSSSSSSSSSFSSSSSSSSSNSSGIWVNVAKSSTPTWVNADKPV